MPDRASYRLTENYRLITLIAMPAFGALLAVIVMLQQYSKPYAGSGAWTAITLILYFCVGIFGVLYVWTLRYELSNDGVCRMGILPRKSVRWDQLKKIMITPPNEMRLEQRDGTILSLPSNDLAGGKQLRTRVLELAGTTPVEEFVLQAQIFEHLRHLPFHAVTGGVASLAIWYAGLPRVVLCGIGWGVAFALLVIWNLRRWESGKTPKWLYGISSVILGVLILSSTDEGPYLLVMGASYSGATLALGLLLIPFRRRLLAFCERDSKRQPANERAPEPA